MEFTYDQAMDELCRRADEYEKLKALIEQSKLVEVVRCGECKHFDKYRDGTKRGACNKHNSHVNIDGYCSYGERRE